MQQLKSNSGFSAVNGLRQTNQPGFYTLLAVLSCCTWAAIATNFEKASAKSFEILNKIAARCGAFDNPEHTRCTHLTSEGACENYAIVWLRLRLWPRAQLLVFQWRFSHTMCSHAQS
jgi:hypothetical protein